MVDIGIFYGSTNGDTAYASRLIRTLCEKDPALKGWATVELVDIAEFMLEEMLDFPIILVGAPTWDIGQLQKDWQAVFDEFEELDLSGKYAAVFGMGDQRGYPDTFADAIFFLADKLQERGATLVGRWPTAGYEFTASWAVVDGSFIGLPLDDINQPDQTEPRLRAWLLQIRSELDLLTEG